MKRSLVKNVTIGCLATVLLFLIFSQIYAVRKLESIDFEAVAREKMQKAVAMFNELFSETDSLTRILVPLLSSNPDGQKIEKRLQTTDNQYFLSGIYLIPSDNGPIMFFSNDNQRFKRKDDLLIRPKWMPEAALQDTIWGGPVFDSAHDRRMIYCSVPYETEGKKKASIVFSYDTQKVYNKLSETGLSRFGLPYMMDSSSHFIAHPLDEIRSMLELGQIFNDDVLIRMSNDIIDHHQIKDKYRHINTVTNKMCDEILFPISETGWLIGLSVYDGIPLETGEYQKELREDYIRLIIYCTILFLLVCKSINNRKTIIPVYGPYLVYPTVLLFMIVAIVTSYNRYPQQSKVIGDVKNIEKWDPKRIIDRQSLNGFVDIYQQESIALYNETAKVIPTGIYIYSVEFLDSHTIKINGTFWQKYLISGVSYPEEMEAKYNYDTYENKGLFFPGGHINNLESLDSMEVVMENYPAVLYRWNFDMETEQQLSYSLYPFGKNELSLTLWSNDLDDNTILTPDLEAYKQIYPTDKPGLDNHFHVKGWDVSGSYYAYSMESYLCNFGNNDIYGVNEFPELLYNISISRKFIDILICKIVPLIVVLVLLFTILFVRVKADGFNNIIGCSGLFFVLVLDHINLRESVLSEQIMYLEFCYFLSYILLLLITITSFDISQNGRSYNLWVDTVLKKYFWTIIFGAMAVITIVFFY